MSYPYPYDPNQTFRVIDPQAYGQPNVIDPQNSPYAYMQQPAKDMSGVQFGMPYNPTTGPYPGQDIAAYGRQSQVAAIPMPGQGTDAMQPAGPSGVGRAVMGGMSWLGNPATVSTLGSLGATFSQPSDSVQHGQLVHNLGNPTGVALGNWAQNGARTQQFQTQRQNGGLSQQPSALGYGGGMPVGSMMFNGGAPPGSMPGYNPGGDMSQGYNPNGNQRFFDNAPVTQARRGYDWDTSVIGLSPQDIALAAQTQHQDLENAQIRTMAPYQQQDAMQRILENRLKYQNDLRYAGPERASRMGVEDATRTHLLAEAYMADKPRPKEPDSPEEIDLKKAQAQFYRAGATQRETGKPVDPYLETQRWAQSLASLTSAGQRAGPNYPASVVKDKEKELSEANDQLAEDQKKLMAKKSVARPADGWFSHGGTTYDAEMARLQSELDTSRKARDQIKAEYDTMTQPPPPLNPGSLITGSGGYQIPPPPPMNPTGGQVPLQPVPSAAPVTPGTLVPANSANPTGGKSVNYAALSPAAQQLRAMDPASFDASLESVVTQGVPQSAAEQRMIEIARQKGMLK